MTVGKIYCAKLIYENYKFLKRKGDNQVRSACSSSSFIVWAELTSGDQICLQDGGNVLGRFVGGNGYRNVHNGQDTEHSEVSIITISFAVYLSLN